ncbi:ABC transporter substrate-binding protein [Frankia nepalensis]|uniref:ABC transporter substrate-binding protein n=1 Tax=Frankia nepalensis TaxID=1836974 RepID=UPI0027DD4A01|nr:ABC transporter substrate-binding protein [Frankia nepalensis]
MRHLRLLPRPARVGNLSGTARPDDVVRLRGTTLVVAVTAATTLAAGCGSGAAGGNTSCGTPGFSADQVKIGFVYPDSGSMAQVFTATRAGFVARVEKANADGGIHGRNIVYEWRDDQGDEARNLNAVRELVDQEQVFGLAEATTASSGGADYLRDLNVPVFGLPVGAEWSDRSYPNMFAVAYLGPAGESVTTFGRMIKAQGGTRAAIITSDVGQSDNGLGLKIVRSLEAVGVDVVPQRFVYNATHTDVAQLAAQLKAADVDVVTGGVTARDLGQIMRGGRAAGLPARTIYLAADGYDKALLQEEGPAIAGMYTWAGAIPWNADTPAQRDYLDAMRRYAPEQQPPDQDLAVAAYLLTDLFLTGLDKAGACPTRADFIQDLRNTDGYDAGGLMSTRANLRDWGHMNPCYTFVRVNAQGTGYDVVPDPARGTQNWCGELLPAPAQ